MSITKHGTEHYSFKIGSEVLKFPTLSFLKKDDTQPKANGDLGVDLSDEKNLIKVIPGSNPARAYYDLFPDLSVTQTQEISKFIEKKKIIKTTAIQDLSMFPEQKMNHFIKLLELSNICTKGVFFVTSGTSDKLMKMRETQDFKKMGEQLINCLEDPSVEFIVMYLNLNVPDTGIWSLLKGKILSHRNSIIIDKKNRKIIRFEPMGAMPKAHQNITIVNIYMQFLKYLEAANDNKLKEHMDLIKSFEYFDTNKFDIFSCPFISAPQLGNIFCQTYSIYGALLYIINSDVFNKTPSSLFVALGDTNKIMLMWYLSGMLIKPPGKSSSSRRSATHNSNNHNSKKRNKVKFIHNHKKTNHKKTKKSSSNSIVSLSN